MHWIGLLIALLGGLLSTGLCRSYIREYYPTLNDTLFDVVFILLIIIGLGLATAKYYIDQKEIKDLEDDVDLINYQAVSQYNAMGNSSGSINGVRMVSTPINDWNKEYAYYDDNVITFKCKPGAKETCLKVINKLPFYPFSYYFLAQCLKEEDDNSWLEMAAKAKSILEKTTRIPGHKSDHDKVLRRVNIMLEGAEKD